VPEFPAGATTLVSRPWATTAGHCLQPLRAVMSVPIPQLLRGLTHFTPWLPVQHAQIHSKPPREGLGTMDDSIGLTSCFLFPPAIRLGPVTSGVLQEMGVKGAVLSLTL